MTGEAHWLTPLVLISCALGIGVLFYFGKSLDRRFQLTRRRFDCPVHKEEVESTLIRDEKTKELTSVQSCSHFANPARVMCDQHCIDVLNASSRGGSERRTPPS